MISALVRSVQAAADPGRCVFDHGTEAVQPMRHVIELCGAGRPARGRESGRQIVLV